MNKPKFGFADTIITPLHPEYMYLDGYGFRSKPAEGVRDELHAKVCAIVNGEKTFLLFSLDLVGLRKRTYDLVAAQITEILGISKEDMALCCIHTHSAPATGLLDELPVDTDYFAYVGECCALAAKNAIERACEGSFSFGILPEKLMSCYNRRKDRDVIDRNIRAAAFRDSAGALRGVICSASCHAVINNTYNISADWLAELNSISSDELPYIYLQGRGADIDPTMHLELPREELLTKLGHELCEPVCRFANSTCATPPITGEFKRIYEIVNIPMKQISDLDHLKDRIKKCVSEYTSIPISDHKKHYKLRELQWLRHMLRIAEQGESFDLSVPLQCLAIGNACVFAFVPFELLTLTGNKLEEIFVNVGFPREAIYACGYSNTTEGYLAPSEEFEFGGYEVSGSNRWYNIPETTPESEGALLSWFESAAQKLK